MDPPSVADPDPRSGAFLTPGSGMGRKSASGSGNRFFGLKYLNSLMRIRDPGWRQSDPGSGINIPDPQHWIHPVPLMLANIGEIGSIT